MKIKLILLTGCVLISFSAFTQISVDSTDMPRPGDIIDKTEISDLTGVDYETADSNYLWDFSMIDGNQELADTFISVNSTPITYIAVFNNPFDQEHRATVASPQASFPSIPGINIENPIAFYKNKSSYFGQVGYGAEINGLPVPVKFDDADIQYHFPMEFGDQDTSLSFYDINIPSLGYNSQSRYRINIVDGWGVLYVPGDTFDVMRIKSVVQITDSIYIDSLGFGFGFDRTETEYKWFSKESHMPVLFIVHRQGGMGGNTDGWFLDHRLPIASVNGSDISAESPIYPNPACNYIVVPGIENESFTYKISHINGAQVQSGILSGTECVIDVSRLVVGHYLIYCTSDNSSDIRRFQVIR